MASLIGNDQTTTVKRDRTEAINRDARITIARDKTETVALTKMLSVGGLFQTSVGAAMNTTVGLSQSEQVGPGWKKTPWARWWAFIPIRAADPLFRGTPGDMPGHSARQPAARLRSGRALAQAFAHQGTLGHLGHSRRRMVNNDA